jgi:hypothetical protein
MGLALLLLLLAAHLASAIFFLTDLYSVSQRANRFQWLLCLALLPVVGVILYQNSRKRNKPHN